jgi:CDP-diacylglycerol--glycerol-3-phosphate 3-phosphatidyltransferase
MEEIVMNLANKLTMFRIILVPIMLIVGIVDRLAGIPGSFLGISTAFWIMEIIFIIASITDKLDGYIARSRNQVTTFGKFLDPIADKILVLTAMIIFVEYGRMPAWIPVIVMFREFIVSGFRLVASGKGQVIAVEKGGKVIAASVWGKLKTVTQMIALILCFLDNNGFAYFVGHKVINTGALVLNIIVTVILIISVIATIFSGWDYIKKGKDLLFDEQ